MRGGWRAYGFEEVEFRLSSVHGDAPTWSLNEAVRNRLTLRPGVFEEPPRMPQDDLLEAPLEGVGPEPISMPPGFEEVLEAGPEVDLLEPVMRLQRNSSVLSGLMQAIAAETAEVVGAFQENQTARADAGEVAVPEEDWDLEAPLLQGISRMNFNHDLAQLLSFLLQATEKGSQFTGAATKPEEVFDLVWRSAAPDYLDCVLVRWRTKLTANKGTDTQDTGATAEASSASGAGVDSDLGEPAATGAPAASADAAASRSPQPSSREAVKAFGLPAPAAVKGSNITRMLINAIILADQSIAFRLHANAANMRTKVKSTLETLTGLELGKGSRGEAVKMKPGDLMALLKAMNLAPGTTASKSNDEEVDEWGD